MIKVLDFTETNIVVLQQGPDDERLVATNVPVLYFCHSTLIFLFLFYISVVMI